MSNFMDFLRKATKLKCEIHVKINEDKEEAYTEAEGNIASILTGISLLVSNLKDKGVPEELIEGAINVGLEKKDKHKSKSHDEIEIFAGKLEGKKAEEFKKFLEELGVK